MTEVVREMSERVRRGIGPRPLTETLADWSAAIADHLARLEALASEFERQAPRGARDADNLRYVVHRLRALLSHAGAAADAAEGGEE